MNGFYLTYWTWTTREDVVSHIGQAPKYILDGVEYAWNYDDRCYCAAV